MRFLREQFSRQWAVLLLLLALLVTNHIQTNASNESIRVADNRAEAACLSARKTVREVNLRTDAFIAVRDSLSLLVVQIRKTRSNEGGTSFSPDFVDEIDRKITPSLKKITPKPVERPRC